MRTSGIVGSARLSDRLPRNALLEELARGVVGEHLATGLTGGAVVDRVSGVLDGAHDVAAHRAGLTCAAVDGAWSIFRRAHVVAGAFVGEPFLDTLAYRRDHLGRSFEAELAGHRERARSGGVTHLVGQAAAETGDGGLVAQEAVQPLVSRLEQRQHLLRVDLVRLRSELAQRRGAERL